MAENQRFLVRLGGVLAAVWLVVAGVPAQAQGDTMFGSQFIDSQMNNIRIDSMRRHMLDLDSADTPQPAAKPATPAGRPAAPARATSYRASPTVTARVREQFLKWIGQTTSAEGEKAMRQLMAQRDILAMWASQMRTDGLRQGDLADALTAYWVQNWQMANAVETTQPAHVQAVRAQVAGNLGANGLTDAQRQELSEIYIYNQFVQGTAWIDAGEKGNRAMQRKLGDAAVARFQREMGVNLRALKLGSAGFTPR